MDEEGKKPDEEKSLGRRYFLELIGLGSIGMVTIGSIALGASYLSPNVVKEPPTRFKIGIPEDFAPGSVTRVEGHNVLIVRAHNGNFYALSAVCTHLGCIVNWKPDLGIIACPCHGSKYDVEGDVIHGPAPRPLPHFAMTQDEQGFLIVDTGTIVEESTMLKV